MGSHVLFTARQEATTGVYSTLANGSQTPLRLDPEASSLMGIVPDGSRALIEGPDGISSVPVTGGPRLLLLPSTELTLFELSPDSRHVVLRRSAFSSDRLWRVAVDGSSPALLLAEHQSITSAGSKRAISSDGAWLVYIAGGTAFSVRMNGSGPPIQLSPTPAGGLGLDSFGIAPDSRRVVLNGNLETLDRVEIFSVPIDGSGPLLKLNSPPGGSAIGSRTIGAGNRLVYLADHDVAGQSELFSVAVDGSSGPLELNAPLSAGEVWTHALAPDGRRIVYAAGPSTARELFLTSIDASAPAVPLNSGFAGKLKIGPDGTRVAYERPGTAVDPGVNYFSLPLDRSAPPIQLDGSPVPIRGQDFSFSPDGSRIVYQERNNAGHLRLFSVSAAGAPAPVPLTDHLPPFASADSFTFSSDGNHALYVAERHFDGIPELESAPIDGSGAAVTLNGRLLQQIVGSVLDYQISPAGEWLVYRAYQETPGVAEIYAIRFGAFYKLNAPLGTGAQVHGFRISPDGARVVYLVRQYHTGLGEYRLVALMSVPIDASAPPVRLNGDLVAFGQVFDFQFTADGSRVVYRATQEHQSTTALYSVPTDGSTPPVRISGAVVPGEEVGSYRISADATRVVYVADQEVIGVADLYSAPILGGATPVRLSQGHGAGASIRELELSPDSARAVFLRNVSARNELLSAPIDGSGAPVELTPPLAPNRGAADFRISADSRRVFYRSDQDRDGFYQLYGVALDGSTTSRRVHSSQARVDEYLLTADGTRLVYNARLGPAASDLYAVPADGSSPPLRLNPGPATGSSILPLALSPSGERVLYRGSTATALALFSVPIDASAPALEISGDFVSGGRVRSAALSPDGTWVVFQADRLVRERLEVFSVPLDGSLAPRRENRELAPFTGSAGAFQISPDSRAVAYLARQDTDATELYASFLLPVVEGPTKPAGPP